MTDKKRDNKELYAFIGIVSLIFFVGYDGFFNEEMIRGGGGSKTAFGKIIIGFILRAAADNLLIYLLFRGLFLVITLWMGYKIYKVTRKGIS